MQTKTSIYIPKPCHEDWNRMTPTQQGKFCSSCAKQVIDFSLMSDQQILNFLSHQSGKLCGRFDAEQLQRPLIETKIKKKKSWWMALIMPLLFLFDRSEAQEIIPKQNHLHNKAVHQQPTTVGLLVPKIVVDTASSVKEIIKEQLIGKVAICEPSKQIIINGKVVDENNNLVPFATITQKGTKHATAADAEGKFLIKVDDDRHIILIASAVGFENVERTMETEQNDSVNIVMKKTGNDLGGVVVVVAGGIVPAKPVKPIDTIKTTVTRIFKLSAFKLYPNPTPRGSSIHLTIKSSGDYQMQLLDNQSRLMQAEEINVDTENSTKQIQLTSNIAAGIYYLRLINEQTKKSYTEKLIIQ